MRELCKTLLWVTFSGQIDYKRTNYVKNVTLKVYLTVESYEDFNSCAIFDVKPSLPCWYCITSGEISHARAEIGNTCCFVLKMITVNKQNGIV